MAIRLSSIVLRCTFQDTVFPEARRCPALCTAPELCPSPLPFLLALPGTTPLWAQAPVAGLAARNTLPLKPTRTLTFTTTKGTWMSLDVSPDGQTIVFDLLGDLYTMPIAGGKATRAHAAAWPSTRSRASRPTARRSSSSPTAAAATTSG